LTSRIADPALLALVSGPMRLRPFDLALVAVYLIGITLFGLSFRKRRGAGEKSLKSYFLADNTIPWWAIALSIVSAETSTLTIISIPGVAFAGDFGFLQVVLGYMLGRIVVSALFLPRYFAGQMLTAYQLIDRRFGPALHKVTAGLFLLTRAAAEGVRVFAVSIVVAIAIGTGDVLSIAIISALTLLYTFEGGMAAVVWTDVVQMAIYIGGTLVALWSLGHHIPGGWQQIHTIAGAAGKFHMFDFALNLTTTYTFWAGVLGGTFLTMASHGTDQLMVQRLLAARSLRESRAALLSSGVVIFIQFAFFLLIGVGLYVFYGQHPTSFASADRIFPTFIVREMPIGIAGLLVAAILAAAMSNLSAALNSLSSTTVVDFYMHLRPKADDRERTLVSKSSTALWAIVLFAIAIYSISAGGKGHVVEIGLSIASVAYGCLLGVFLLGTLTKFATQWGAIIGMGCGFIMNIALWQFPGKEIWTSSIPICDVTTRPGPFSIIIPHIAWTWYVLIGAFVTFAIGALASLLFRKQSRITVVSAAILLLFCFSAHAQTLKAAPDFSQVSQLINDAIAAHKLPGAVVGIGHNGKIVFHHAYGNRKLAGEPGPQGELAAEPMTEDTIFDMASLTKDLATATGIMQLYEAGKITAFDDPLEKYLPDFNATHDATRSKVTLRMLLTHFSGEAPDVDLRDAWGLATPDHAEGIRRALTTPLHGAPGATFVYSDINFILLGALIEKLSGQPEDVYATEHIFQPLGMRHTRYLPIGKACGEHIITGAAIALPPNAHHEGPDGPCTGDQWLAAQWIESIAPTAHDDESKTHPELNPDFDHLLRATVHDPSTRRMGGVAGHAGVFSNANDVSLYASALLEKLLHNTGPFPLKQSTLQLMTQPEEPGRTPGDLAAANAAAQRAIAAGEKNTASPLLASSYPAIKGKDLRGFGWDIDTAFSKPRGRIFPIGSFGHTGFTGTTLWMDPSSDTYVVLLANAIHPRGNPPISTLRGEVATAAAQALGLDKSPALKGVGFSPSMNPPEKNGALAPEGKTLTGIDVLESTHFAALEGLHHIAVLTNQNGLDSQGKRTIDILASLTANNQQLTTIFTPEHGLSGVMDQSKVASTTDPTTHLTVISLYGPKDSDKRPSHEQLKELDAVVIDLQDAGVHFWTYESVLGYMLEAGAREQTEFHHPLQIVVLDRPNPVGGLAVQGPIVDPGRESYVAYTQVPVRHGLTFGELARYIVASKHLDAKLTVVTMQNWKRSMFWADTGLPWINPSPNLRSPAAAILYPAIGLIEFSNISVGRGTAHPFSFFGAGVASPQKPAATDSGIKAGVTLPSTSAQNTTAQLTTDTRATAPQSATATVTLPLHGAQPASHSWFHADEVAMELNARHIPGVTFTPTREAISEDANHYPFHGQTIEAVRVNATDPVALDTPELGVEILSVLHRLYPAQFNLERDMPLIANRATVDAIARGDDPRTIAATWQPALAQFKAACAPILFYK
jgi:SSS family transporter